jgi:hypothetical protein
MRKPLIVGLLFVLLAGCLAVAQETSQPATTTQTHPAASSISKYIWVSIGTTNPGKGKIFTNLVRQIRDTANSENANFFWLAGYSLTGDDRQVTFVSFHNDLASVDREVETSEKVMRAAAMKNAGLATESAESEGPSRSVLAKYREDLSYRPDLVDAAHATRWSVTTFQLKPGTSTDFADLAKQYADLVKQTNDPSEHWIAYQVLAGLPGPAFMIVTPMKSLADMDLENEAAMKAVFTKAVRQELDATEQKIVDHVETQFIAVAPELSRPPQTMIAANPTFWTVKEEGVAMAAKEKKGKKEPVEPASKKEEKKQ